MVPVVAMVSVGWLLLLTVLLVAPPAPRDPGTRGDLGTRGSGDEAPAVVSLLAGRLGAAGFGATLVDLASRGWFELGAPAGTAPGEAAPGEAAPGEAAPGEAAPGRAAPSGTVMCVVGSARPAGGLAPFERRVVAHVALRAGARGEVPAAALADGFEGGEAGFMKAFGDEVAADANQRGLVRPRLSAGRIGLLCALLLIPAGALLNAIGASRQHAALLYLGLAYLSGCGLTIRIGTSRRRSAAGREALRRCRAGGAAPPGARPRGG
jgi:hypothetical protein